MKQTQSGECQIGIVLVDGAATILKTGENDRAGIHDCPHGNYNLDSLGPVPVSSTE